uniref:Protein kinase domain-containing protein n=1 Tax=Neogobius melanostomus TaxID=47308 RepID=A0A8C6UXE4_9GOBI
MALEEVKAIPKEYTFLKVLGEGAFSKVVKCVKKETGEEVAIKIIHRGTADEVEFEVRFDLMLP